MVHEGADRLGRGVAYRNQAIVRQDERDRRGRRIAVLQTEEHAYRHVERAVALVETARRLDLRQFALRRHVEVDATLDERFFVSRGLLEIDPGGGVGDAVFALRFNE